MMQNVAERLLAAITTRDFAALEAALEPSSYLRALLPNGVVEEAGSAGIARRFRDWFGTAEVFEVLEARAEITGDRPSLQYRFRLRRPGDVETLISQHVVLIGTDGGATAMHIVCTGFRAAQASTGALHDYDAGTLGCGDGLADAFKRQMREVGVGDLLRVHTIDPAAKEDLPSLARLMGHKIHSVEAHADGGLIITVERKR